MSTSTDRSDLDAKTDAGPGVGRGATAYAPEDAEFDREIDIRSIVGSGAALMVVTLVAAVIVWLLLRGIGSYDKRRDVPLSPIEAATPQQPPPEPRLETAPSQLLESLRGEEDLVLNHAGWVNPQQGTVRVPIDVAIDVIAARGVAPQGGAGTAMNPDQTRIELSGTPADVRRPGATVQNALPAAPAAPAPPPQ